MFSIIVVFNVNPTCRWYFICVCLHLLQSIQLKVSTCSDGDITCKLTSTKKYSFVQFTAISARVKHGILNFNTSMWYLNDDGHYCFYNCKCKDISLFIAIIQGVSKFILVCHLRYISEFWKTLVINGNLGIILLTLEFFLFYY